MAADRRGQRQTAYHILVASSADLLAKDQADLWDSGRIASDRSIHVEYAGKPLPSRMRCHWKARIWDQDGKVSAWSKPASWSMGLLKPDDWKGRWITASKWFMPREYRPIGFCTAATASPDAPAWADVDLGQATSIDRVRLHPYTVGQFPLRFRIEASDILDYDRPQVIADCSAEDYRLAAGRPLDFAGRGVKARYVRLFIVRSPKSRRGLEALPEHGAADGNLLRREECRAHAADPRVRHRLGRGPCHLPGRWNAVGRRRRCLSAGGLPYDRCPALAQILLLGRRSEAGDAVLCRLGHGGGDHQRAEQRRRGAAVRPLPTTPSGSSISRTTLPGC